MANYVIQHIHFRCTPERLEDIRRALASDGGEPMSFHSLPGNHRIPHWVEVLDDGWKFETKWEPPDGALEAISEMFPDVEFVVEEYHEGSDFLGTGTWMAGSRQGGEMIPYNAERGRDFKKHLKPT